MLSCHRSTVLKRSLQRKSEFHLVSGKASIIFLHTRFLLNLGHVLHQRCQCLMHLRGVTKSLFFLPAKESAGHGKFGKRKQRPNMYSCLFSVDQMFWLNPSEVTRTRRRSSVRQDQPNDEG